MPNREMQLRLAAIFALIILACLPLACKRSSKLNIDSLVHDYLQLAVALGERDPDSLDFYFGPDSLVREVRNAPPKLEVIRQQAIALGDSLHKVPVSTKQETERVEFLTAQVDAIALRTQMLSGHNLSFDAESRIFFHVTANEDRDEDTRTSVRKKLKSLLGNSNNLSHVYTVFDRRFLIPPDKVPALMNEALRQCRARTLSYIELPADEQVQVEYVSHKPWSAFSRYLGHAHSVIQINMDFPLTVDRILNLACHEGYPGHHVFNTIRDQSLVQSMHREEWLIQPTFSPQSFVSEAAASYASDLAFRPEERLQIERDLLFPLAGLDPSEAERYLRVQDLIALLHTAEPAIARDYLDGHLEFVRAAGALGHETLMEHAETMLLYLNEYRSYMLTYTIGRDKVQSFIEYDHPGESTRWRRYQQLMREPVSMLCSHNPEAGCPVPIAR